MSSKKPKTKPTTVRSEESYETLVGEVQSLVELVRQQAARSVNSVMTATYWFIGRRIVEEEQKGKRRANYGKQLIKGLSTHLTDRLGRGFGERNLRHMRAFYRSRPTLLDPPYDAFPNSGAPEIWQTLSAKLAESPSNDIWQTLSAESPLEVVMLLARLFPLPWSHYVKLLSVEDPGYPTRGRQGRSAHQPAHLRLLWTKKSISTPVQVSLL